MGNKLTHRKGDHSQSSSSNSICTRANLFIPDCILINILCKLPAKLVISFKCVSKHWLSLISTSYFAGLYRSLHPDNRWVFLQVKERVRFGYTNNLKKLMYDHYKSPTFSKISVIPFEVSKASNLMLVASSNGLLLCKEVTGQLGYGSVYWILNPITLHFVKLPMRPVMTSTECVSVEGFLTREEPVGFVASYKVVCPLSVWTETSVRKFQIFSSENGRWDEFDVHFPQPLRFTTWLNPIVYNGILHWLSNSDHGNNIFVIAYDPYTRVEACRTFAFPHTNTSNICFDIVRGHLGCILMDNPWLQFSNISNWSWKIWTLKDYANGEWTIEYDFSSSLVGKVRVDARLSRIKWTLTHPIIVHPFDSNIIYFEFEHHDNHHACSYNIQTQSLTEVKRCYYSNETNVWAFPLPFVVPSWPSTVINWGL